MKLRNPHLVYAAGTAAAGLIRLWTATLRNRIAALGAERQPPHPDDPPTIYAFWHESILPMSYFGRGISILISQHADGELIAVAARWLGMRPVRGSSTRGGAAALLEMIRRADVGHLAVTPDGPRGPRRRVQIGIVALAAHTGLPIVPVGVACDRAGRANTWDRFMLPTPGTSARFVTGPALTIPPVLDRKTLESSRQLVEEQMLTATELAEQWAASGQTPTVWPTAAPVRAA
jgi:lysophospholipid acyltransferase (LPLAT)-like uncharacterized protein